MTGLPTISLGLGSQGVAVYLCAHPLLVQDSLGLCLYAKRSLLSPIRKLEAVFELASWAAVL